MLKRFTTQHFFHCFSFVIQLVHVWTQTLKHLYFAPGRLLVFYPGGGGCTTYIGLFGEAPPGRNIQAPIYERATFSFKMVYKR